MNIIKLMGGLGNQLFQYSFGKALELNGAKVKYDISWYKKERYPIRELLLPYLGITLQTTDSKLKVLKETSYDPNILDKRGFYFYGYWQYLKYHKNSIPIIKKEINFDLLETNGHLFEYQNFKKILSDKNTVAIHVRRGDYLEKGHTVLPISYYEKAFQYFSNSIKLIFSDDIDWCIKNIKGAFYVNGSPLYDFLLMSSCKHQIIANSTYSWWAAMLNPNKHKKIIAPKEFVVRKEDQNNYNNKIHYPNEWIKI